MQEDEGGPVIDPATITDFSPFDGFWRVIAEIARENALSAEQSTKAG